MSSQGGSPGSWRFVLGDRCGECRLLAFIRAVGNKARRALYTEKKQRLPGGTRLADQTGVPEV
jgi:hypothetical protein